MNTFTHEYALLIGVGATKYTDWLLPVTVEDPRAMKKLLADPARCAYPDDDQHLRLLYDSTATKTAILDGLRWLKTCAETDKDATIIVFNPGTAGWKCLPASTTSFRLM